jgi:hypothetical protein
VELELDAVELDSLLVLDAPLSDEPFEPLSDEPFVPPSEAFDEPVSDEPFAEDVDERESVMYQPLPLKTIPTG